MVTQPTFLNPPPPSRDVPGPRYPFFIHPTASNWFRTTVNPLVWALIELECRPVSSTLIGRASILMSKWMLIDTWMWDMVPSTSPGASLEDRVRHRPDSLFDPSLMTELFALLTTGRSSDLRRAHIVFKALASRHSGAEPERWEFKKGEEIEARETFFKRPSRNRPGREELLEDLRQQAVVWELATAMPEPSDRSISIQAAEKLGISASHTGNHLTSRRFYLHLLRNEKLLQDVVLGMYCDLAGDHSQVALRTLHDAIEWLDKG